MFTYRLLAGGGYDPYNSAVTHPKHVIAAVERAHENRRIDELIRRGIKLGINVAYGRYGSVMCSQK